MDLEELKQLRRKADLALACLAEEQTIFERSALREDVHAYLSAVDAILSLHREREEPIVCRRHCDRKTLPPAGDERTVVVREELHEPPVLESARGVEIEREREGLLFGPGDERREELSGANIENGRRAGHVAPWDDETLEHIATDPAPLTHAQLRRCRQRVWESIGEEAARLHSQHDPSEIEAVIDLRAKWKRDAVQEFYLQVAVMLAVPPDQRGEG